MRGEAKEVDQDQATWLWGAERGSSAVGTESRERSEMTASAMSSLLQNEQLQGLPWWSSG